MVAAAPGASDALTRIPSTTYVNRHDQLYQCMGYKDLMNPETKESDPVKAPIKGQFLPKNPPLRILNKNKKA